MHVYNIFMNMKMANSFDRILIDIDRIRSNSLELAHI